jgi:hypothetical protein
MAQKTLHRKWMGKISRVMWRNPECPVCTSIEFRRPPHQSMRSIFRLANLIPLQCTNCWQHFYWLKSERGFEAHAKLHDWRG